MKTPPFLNSAALLLWGWQTEFVLPAAVMVLVLESARFIKERWDFSESDFRRLSILCSIALVMAVIIALDKDTRHLILLVVQWLPMVLFPLMAAQQFSLGEKVHGASLLLVLRRRLSEETTKKLVVNISYPYFAICLVSAAGANVGRQWFYLAVVVMTAWALWPLRSRPYPIHLWIVLIVTCSVMGYAVHQGAYRLQRYGYLAYRFFTDDNNDPFKTNTAIGDVGVLKQSDRIVFRLMPGQGLRLPLLLREAAYTVFDGATWFATHSGFDPVRELADDTGTWYLFKAGQGIVPQTLQIAVTLKKGKNLLKLPGGTFRIDDLAIPELEMNPLGAVRTRNDAGFALFQATYDPGQTFNRPPGPTDLKIPEEEAPAIKQIASQLGLAAKKDRAAIDSVSSFFRSNFSYSIYLPARAGRQSALADFLLKSRTGHCEYFATATVLLLRAAGIPARYVSGYAASEYSEMEEMVVVRQRHAHAWAIAFVDGEWVQMDTTPPVWSAIEAARAPALSAVWDLFSFLRFKLSMWLLQSDDQKTAIYWIIPLVILFLVIGRRIFQKQLVKRADLKKETGRKKSPIRPESIEDLYAVEKWLLELGHERRPEETFQGWFGRLAVSAPEIVSFQTVQTLVPLHYRERFGQAPLNGAERQRLQEGVRTIVANALANGRDTPKVA